MAKNKKKRYDSAFKAKVAVEAIKGDKTLLKTRFKVRDERERHREVEKRIAWQGYGDF